MSSKEAQALRVRDLAGFRQYMRDLFAATEDFLASADDSVLAKVSTVRPIGAMTGAQALTRTCLTHGCTHLGEIELTGMLLGLPTAGGA